MSRLKRLSYGPIMLLYESPDPALAFWGRLARVVFPTTMVAGPVFMLILGRHFGTLTYRVVGIGYLTLLVSMGLIAFVAGRTAAKMSDEQRAAAMPESLLATGRTSKTYWENQAVVGGLLIAFCIFGIALVVTGVL